MDGCMWFVLPGVIAFSPITHRCQWLFHIHLTQPAANCGYISSIKTRNGNHPNAGCTAMTQAIAWPLEIYKWAAKNKLPKMSVFAGASTENIWLTSSSSPSSLSIKGVNNRNKFIWCVNSFVSMTRGVNAGWTRALTRPFAHIQCINVYTVQPTEQDVSLLPVHKL